jgi:hypothetical protein
MNIIARAGLPVPRKSACYFCPFHRPSEWQRLKADEPDLFAKAVALEALLNERRDELGKDHVYLTRYGQPLDAAMGPDIQGTLAFDGEDCESGYCMT